MLLEIFVPFSRWTGIPPFTFPFVAATLFTIYALRLVSSPLLAAGFGRTPEEVRENFLASRLRYRGQAADAGPALCRQVVRLARPRRPLDAPGHLALCLRLRDRGRRGQTHRGDGGQLKDYYCYRMPVLSPVAGRVVRVVNDMTDNPVGTVSGGSNWGNLVLLHDPRGFYVELSHFTPQSIRVKAGDEVEQGAVLGLCGSSGHSPQPHIHVQAQGERKPDGRHLAFQFRELRCAATPTTPTTRRTKAQRVEPLCREKRLEEATSFVLDDRQEFDVFRDGRPAGKLVLRVGLAADGTRFLESDRGKLYYGKHEGTFYFYRVEGDDPYLQLLFLALPKLPLAYRAGLQWHDYLPTGAVTSGLWRAVLRLGSLVYPPLASIKVQLAFTGRNTVESTVKSRLLGLHAPGQLACELELDEQAGLARCGRAPPNCGASTSRKTIAPNRGVSPQPSLSRSKLMIACGLLSLAALTTLVGFVADTGPDAQVRQAVEQSIQLEKGRDYPKAIEALLAQSANHPPEYDYLVNLRLGWLYYLNGKYADADANYQAAIKARPDSVEAKLGRLLPLLAAGKSPEAAALAREILKDHPHNYYANLRLAVALRLEKKYDEARRILQRMLVAYPADTLYAAELAAVNAAQAAEPGSPAAAPAGSAEDVVCRGPAALAAVRGQAEVRGRHRRPRRGLRGPPAKLHAEPADGMAPLPVGRLLEFRPRIMSRRPTPRRAPSRRAWAIPCRCWPRPGIATWSYAPARSSKATRPITTPTCGWPSRCGCNRSTTRRKRSSSPCWPRIPPMSW